jgi:hypothetical protein
MCGVGRDHSSNLCHPSTAVLFPCVCLRHYARPLCRTDAKPGRRRRRGSQGSENLENLPDFSLAIAAGGFHVLDGIRHFGGFEPEEPPGGRGWERLVCFPSPHFSARPTARASRESPHVRITLTQRSATGASRPWRRVCAYAKRLTSVRWSVLFAFTLVPSLFSHSFREALRGWHSARQSPG